MADHKFTLEEILNEYSADGKRSGIRHTSEQPLSRGTPCYSLLNQTRW